MRTFVNCKYFWTSCTFPTTKTMLDVIPIVLTFTIICFVFVCFFLPTHIIQQSDPPAALSKTYFPFLMHLTTAESSVRSTDGRRMKHWWQLSRLFYADGRYIYSTSCWLLVLFLFCILILINICYNGTSGGICSVYTKYFFVLGWFVCCFFLLFTNKLWLKEKRFAFDKRNTEKLLRIKQKNDLYRINRITLI